MGKKTIALLLALGSLLLSGCLDARSPDEYGYAMMIGIDVGTEKPFYISMLLQRGNGDAQSEPGETCKMAAVECNNLFEAVDLMGGSMPFAINLSRTTAIVFSEEVAKSGKLEQLLTSSLGSLLIRYYANLIVSLGRADAFLEGVQDELAPNVAKLQSSFVEYSEDTGFVPSITLAQFYDKAWSSAGDVILPLGANENESTPNESEAKGSGANEEEANEEEANEKEANEKEASAMQNWDSKDILGEQTYMPGNLTRTGGLASGMMGSAIFKNTVLVGLLNGQNTQVLLMATGQFNHGRMRIPIGQQDVSVTLSHREKPDLRLDLSEPPRAYCMVYLYAAVDQPSEIAGMPEEQVKEDIEKYIEERMQAIFQACQSHKADVFELGKAAVVQFANTRQWEEYDWETVYQSVAATFQVDIEVHNDSTISRLE